MTATSRFTIYNPVTRRVVWRVGGARVSGVAEAKWFRLAERRSERWGLMFDDTCPHDTAFALCSRSTCAAPSDQAGVSS